MPDSIKETTLAEVRCRNCKGLRWIPYDFRRSGNSDTDKDYYRARCPSCATGRDQTDWTGHIQAAPLLSPEALWSNKIMLEQVKTSHSRTQEIESMFSEVFAKNHEAMVKSLFLVDERPEGTRHEPYS